ncbi:MAG: biotin transporter BioY [Burkholderiaceae bacterium]
MTLSTTSARSHPLAQPAWLQTCSPATKVFAVITGTLVLAASSHISVPMIPVPITMQTLAVTLVGALYGWRLGGLTVLAWLAEGAFGLPVFAGGTGGVARFLGPTGGYLLAFPLAAVLTGWLVERGWNGQRILLAFAAMLAGNAVCLLVGASWLATIIGAQKAIAVGLAPFLIGAVLKSALGAALLKAIMRQRGPND